LIAMGYTNLPYSKKPDAKAKEVIITNY